VLEPVRGILTELPFTPVADALAPGLAAQLSFGAMGLAALLLVVTLWRVGRGRTAAQSVTWGCGFAVPTTRMQYTGSSYAAPLLAAFGAVAQPPRRRAPASLETVPDDRVLHGLVEPVWDLVKRGAATLRPIQHGRMTSYLGYMVFTLLLLLLVLLTATVRTR
jgi:hypothetical protein